MFQDSEPSYLDEDLLVDMPNMLSSMSQAMLLNPLLEEQQLPSSMTYFDDSDNNLVWESDLWSL